mgnify:FL=1
MQQLKAKTPEGIEYHYYKCNEDGEEIVDMKQLHEVAEKYRILKKYNVKLSKWGLSLGLRIPKELVEKYKLKNEKEVSIIPEKTGIRIITS